MKKIKLLFFSSPDFTDNALHLYNYFRKQKNPIFHYIWLVYNPKRFKNTDDTTFIARNQDLSILNDVAFSLCSHHTTTQTYQRFNDKHIIINLSHGIGIKGKKQVNQMQKDPYFPSSLFDYIVSLGGPIADETVFKFNNMPDRKKILSLGYPRNDILFNAATRKRDKTTRIIYMPTFKQSLNKNYSEEYLNNETGLALFETKKSLVEVNKWLAEKQISIFFKLHRLQQDLEIFNWMKSNTPNIQILKNSNFERCIYYYLEDFDALLTDYSSIGTDFLFLDLPEGFIFTDLEEYAASRGEFTVDPIKYSAGHHIYNVKDFKQFCIDVKKGNDIHKEKRRSVLNDFCANVDGKSSERIYNFICEKVKELY